MEHWKQLNDTNYMVSTLGRVKSIKTGNIIKPHVAMNGYLRYSLTINGKHVKYYAHLLVLKTFNPTDNQKLEADHINRDIHDNNILNLRWVTRTENMRNRGKRLDRLKPGLVRYIRTLFNAGYSYKEVHELTNVRQNTLFQIRTNRTYKGVV